MAISCACGGISLGVKSAPMISGNDVVMLPRHRVAMRPFVQCCTNGCVAFFIRCHGEWMCSDYLSRKLATVANLKQNLFMVSPPSKSCNRRA